MTMDPEIMERWREVAGKLAREKDAARRLELIAEMDRILSEAIGKPDEARSKGKSADGSADLAHVERQQN